MQYKNVNYWTWYFGGYPSGTTSEVNQPKSSLPISIESEITSFLTGESEVVETEALETLEPKVTEPKFPDLNTLQLEVTQHEEPQITKPTTSGNSSLYLPLSQPQHVFLGLGEEKIPPSILRIEDIIEEDSPIPQNPVCIPLQK